MLRRICLRNVEDDVFAKLRNLRLRLSECLPLSGKLRFVREGTLREDCIVDGEVSDSWVYGLLRREWKQLQSGSAAG
jgi:hypothetical protein